MDLPQLLLNTARSVQSTLTQRGTLRESVAASGPTMADLAADKVATELLTRAGVAVFSEESGFHPAPGEFMVILDPLDGSLNASRGVPHYACSLCAIDQDGPVHACVLDLERGRYFTATRGQGAFCDGAPISPSNCRSLTEAFTAVSGMPEGSVGRGHRILGCASLGLCGVADGTFDAFVDFDDDHHAMWDIAAGLLVCDEAGVSVVDAAGREFWPSVPTSRRSPIAAATTDLLDQCSTLVSQERQRAMELVGRLRTPGA